MDSDLVDEEFVYGENHKKLKKKKDILLDCLKGVIDPDLKKNIVELNFVRNLRINEKEDGKYEVHFDLNLTTPACPVKEELVAECRKKLSIYDWIEETNINITFVNFNQYNSRNKTSTIENVILVYSCKGGVGKSFISVNYAFYLKKKGASVGLLDADINGPSLPTLLPFDHTYVKFKSTKKKSSKIFYEPEGPDERDEGRSNIKRENYSGLNLWKNPSTGGRSAIEKIGTSAEIIDKRECYVGVEAEAEAEFEAEKGTVPETWTKIEAESSNFPGMMEPLTYRGVKLMSYAYIKNKENVGFASFRGPILNEIVKEFLYHVDWGILDYLIIDMPPGTSDIHLDLFEFEKVNGIIMITTPNDMSIVDVEKGINMCNYFNMPIICLIVNMNYFICDNCDKKHYIFNNCNMGLLKSKIKKMYELPFHSLFSQNVYKNEWDENIYPFILAYDNHFLKKQMEIIFENITREISILKYNNILNFPSIQIYKKYYVQLSFDSIENTYVFSDDVLTCHVKDIRLKCSCDICIQEKKMSQKNNTKKKKKKKNLLSRNLYIKEITRLGTYNVKFVWSDNHISVFSYSHLKHIFQKKRLTAEVPHCQSNEASKYEW
ncbi:conserved Plasmodium protein, unknown function [Plasmodium ovale]|uniref:Fe-S cluster assembly protein n=2 Tax=Plasmodium ovale TaxID=36330 RepID=A0A1A8WGZ1_PLAOA|nr:conserved Plasmodium protein, unknown function [Plasmodium ovale curtisi]SCP04614.1 conserved Plasmodium protein, unknown function [Plasmodium ovale]